MKKVEQQNLEYVSLNEAAHLLGICRQRVQQLLQTGRVEGAIKEGRFWKIPLYNNMPRIAKGTRGPEGTWRKRLQKAKTYIHVNKDAIFRNNKNTIKEPVITVRHGSKTTYCDKVDIYGHCQMLYVHDKKKACGARAWIELAPDARFVTHQFNIGGRAKVNATAPECELEICSNY